MYDSAYVLEKAIRESEEFKSLQEAYESVMNDPNSKAMFEEFRDVQLDLQEKQMQGMEITEAELDSARNIVNNVQQHQGIANLMEKEQRLNIIIGDISRIITKPLEELYGGFEEEEE